MGEAKYFVRKTTKKKYVFAPEYRYRVFDTIEGPGGLVDTLLNDDWYVIERGSGYIFAFREKDYALFTWRKEY